MFATDPTLYRANTDTKSMFHLSPLCSVSADTFSIDPNAIKGLKGLWSTQKPCSNHANWDCWLESLMASVEQELHIALGIDPAISTEIIIFHCLRQLLHIYLATYPLWNNYLVLESLYVSWDVGLNTMSLHCLWDTTSQNLFKDIVELDMSFANRWPLPKTVTMLVSQGHCNFNLT